MKPQESERRWSLADIIRTAYIADPGLLEDDTRLYLIVLQVYAQKIGHDDLLSTTSAEDFLFCQTMMGFPTKETVLRTAYRERKKRGIT